MGISQLLGARA